MKITRQKKKKKKNRAVYIACAYDGEVSQGGGPYPLTSSYFQWIDHELLIPSPLPNFGFSLYDRIYLLLIYKDWICKFGFGFSDWWNIQVPFVFLFETLESSVSSEKDRAVKSQTIPKIEIIVVGLSTMAFGRNIGTKAGQQHHHQQDDGATGVLTIMTMMVWCTLLILMTIWRSLYCCCLGCIPIMDNILASASLRSWLVDHQDP